MSVKETQKRFIKTMKKKLADNDCTGIVQDSCVTCAELDECREAEKKKEGA